MSCRNVNSPAPPLAPPPSGAPLARDRPRREPSRPRGRRPHASHGRGPGRDGTLAPPVTPTRRTLVAALGSLALHLSPLVRGGCGLDVKIELPDFEFEVTEL